MSEAGGQALVTGASGFIGGRLAVRLLEEGRDVRVLARDPARLPAALHGRVAVHVGDLGDAAALREAVRGAAVVFHCAANVRTWDSAGAYYRANVEGVRNLLSALEDSPGEPARLVHLSTLDVYGFPVAPCDERSPTPPTGFGYGDSKREGEALVRAWGEASGRPFAILRPGNVFGPGSPFARRIGHALRSGIMLAVDAGRAHAGTLDVDNLVDCLLWAARSPRASGRCYNVRDDHDATWARVLEAFRAGLGRRGRVIDLPFGVADRLASSLEVLWRAVPGRPEPPLHRLLVRVLGRTCGHPTARLRADGAPPGRIGFDESMQRSVRWMLAQEAGEARAPRGESVSR